MEIVAFKNILPNEINNKILKFLSHPTADIIKPYILAHRKFIDDKYKNMDILDMIYIYYSFSNCMIFNTVNNYIVCKECYSEIVKFYRRDDYWEYDYVCDDCNNKMT